MFQNRQAARMNVRGIQIALRMLVGPGFGHPGMTEREAMKELVAKYGMGPSEAFLAIKAAKQLAEEKGIEIRH